MRYPTRAAMDRLSDCLGLVRDPHMQDWHLECADPDRVGEFLDFYEAGTRDDDERLTLMELILGSFDDYDGGDGPEALLWERIRAILTANPALHRGLIEYYQRLDAESEEECFPITPLMREIQVPPEADAGS